MRILEAIDRMIPLEGARLSCEMAPIAEENIIQEQVKYIFELRPVNIGTELRGESH